MAFSQSIIEQAWAKAGARCECDRVSHNHYGKCNKYLLWANRGVEGQGKWEVHSISGLNNDPILDCEILCWDCYTAIRSL